MRRLPIGLIVPVLVVAAATLGLLEPAGERYDNYSTVQIVIAGGSSLDVVGDYYYHPPPMYSGTLSDDLTLHVWCNEPTYYINIRATDITPAADIVLSDFHYTRTPRVGPPVDAVLDTADGLLLEGYRTTGLGVDHSVVLRLMNLTGMEPAGAYTSTVTFSLFAP